MKILLITAHFYPQNRVSVLRLGQWSKYWAYEGHDVTVLTTKKYSFIGHLDYSYTLPKNIQIIEISYLPKWIASIIESRRKKASSFHGSKNEQKSSLIRKVKSSTQILRHSCGSLLDIYKLWEPKAKKEGLKQLREQDFDLIISSYGPPASHIVASYLKEKFPDSFWIADFRDLWTDNHILPAKGAFRLLDIWRENKTLKRANLITTVSTSLSQILQKKFNNTPIHTIENGFDPEEFPDWQKKSTTLTTKLQSTIKISYTGTIYPHKRDPTPLLDAVLELIQENHIHKDQIHIGFYGNNTYELNTLLKKKPSYKQFISLYGMVSREEALNAQKESDLLLFLEWNDPSARGVLTGKLFEYLVSGKPILGVGIDSKTSSGDLIERSGTGLCCLDKNQIKLILLSGIHTNGFTFYRPKNSIINEYSRDKQAQHLLDLACRYKS